MKNKSAQIEFRFRQMVSEDYPVICRFLNSLFSIESDFVFEINNVTNALKMINESNKAYCFVGEVEKQVVGVLSLQEMISTAEGGVVAVLEDFFIDEDFRGKGFGSLMMNGVEEVSKQKGWKRIQLLADKENRGALTFYNKLGWHDTSLIVKRNSICVG